MKYLYTLLLFILVSNVTFSQCDDPALITNGIANTMEDDIPSVFINMGFGSVEFQNPNWFWFEVCGVTGYQATITCPGALLNNNSVGVHLEIFGPYTSADTNSWCSNFQAHICNTCYQGSNYFHIGNYDSPINEGQFYLLLFSKETSYDGLEITVTDDVQVGEDCAPCLPFESPEICVVTSTQENRNKIIWEKEGEDDNVLSYNVWRGEFGGGALVGSVSSADSSFVIDTIAWSSEQAFTYRLETIDTCGVSDWAMNTHQTVHLSASPGFTGENNLYWNAYQTGTAYFPMPNQPFYIYRGSTPDNLVLLDSVITSDFLSFFTYTDLDAPEGEVHYQVAFVYDWSCSPSRDLVRSLIRSNITGYNINEMNEARLNKVRIYPNPASDLITIDFPGVRGRAYNITLHDQLGNLVRDIKASGRATLDTSGLSSGLYIATIQAGTELLRQKLIVQH